MGIEYIIVNLDKKELLDFDRLRLGTKIGAMTSEPIASFLSWLMINPEGYGADVPRMLGRWAGDRIEIVGDEDEGDERQERARREFRDITVEAIKGFAEGSPFERITKLQPMGLIDKEGNVVVDSHARDSVKDYWKEVEKRGNEELDRYIADAPPNGGPATPSGDSGVGEGPPSVS
jgi:hypothetical protein